MSLGVIVALLRSDGLRKPNPDRNRDGHPPWTSGPPTPDPRRSRRRATCPQPPMVASAPAPRLGARPIGVWLGRSHHIHATFSCHCPVRHRPGETTPSGLPDTRPTGALLLLYDAGSARRIAASSLPGSTLGCHGPRRCGWPCPFRPLPGRACSTQRPHRTAGPALGPGGWRRSSRAVSGRPANTAPTPDAGPPRSPCRPSVQPPTPPGNPARDARCRSATAARWFAVRPVLPRQTRYRLRPLRRSTDASHPATTVMSASTVASFARAPTPECRNVVMSRSPGVRVPPLLSLSGLTLRALFSDSPAMCGPARLNAAPAWRIATAWMGREGRRDGLAGRTCAGAFPGGGGRRGPCRR